MFSSLFECNSIFFTNSSIELFPDTPMSSDNNDIIPPSPNLFNVGQLDD